MTDLQRPSRPRRHRARAAIARPDSALADVTERMFSLFESQLTLTTIARVVRHCRRDLEITSGPPHAEQLERLAYERLVRLATSA